MGLLVVGSLGLDDVETPFGKVERALGGSSTYISLASSYFSSKVHMVGVVGSDFPKEYITLFENHNIDLGGLQIVEGGKTFRWAGKYHADLNNRDTLLTELNVFETFDPILNDELKKSKYVVLGNIDPVLQIKVLDQLQNPEFVVCDTMNLWIDIRKNELIELIKRVDVLIINDSEAKLLAEESNLIKAAKIIKGMGLKNLIIKKGEHGALLFCGDKIFSAPAYPLETIFDPTGAGDTFAGGFAGYLEKTQDISFENLKRAVVYGSTMASFCCEQFSSKALEKVEQSRIDNRFNEFRVLSQFDDK